VRLLLDTHAFLWWLDDPGLSLRFCGFDRAGKVYHEVPRTELIQGLEQWTRQGDPIRVGLVQGNVDQAQKWDVSRSVAIFAEYLTMTRQATFWLSSVGVTSRAHTVGAVTPT
jgi:apolipoprotein N-acyltransferase